MPTLKWTVHHCVGSATVLAFALLNEDEYSQHVLIWVALNAVLAVGLRFMLLVGETNIATGAFYGMRPISLGVYGEVGAPFPSGAASGGVLGIMAQPRRSA